MPSMMKAPHSKDAKCAMCGGGECKMAEGGHVKGVNKQHGDRREGTSEAGHYAKYQTSGDDGSKAWTNGKAKEAHRGVLAEQKDMPRPTTGRSGFAHGGEVEVSEHMEPDGNEMDMDTELSHGLGKELMSAFEKKDHKQLMSALEACVLHCMSKGDE